MYTAEVRGKTRPIERLVISSILQFPQTVISKGIDCGALSKTVDTEAHGGVVSKAHSFGVKVPD